MFLIIGGLLCLVVVFNPSASMGNEKIRTVLNAISESQKNTKSGLGHFSSRLVQIGQIRPYIKGEGLFNGEYGFVADSCESVELSTAKEIFGDVQAYIKMASNTYEQECLNTTFERTVIHKGKLEPNCLQRIPFLLIAKKICPDCIVTSKSFKVIAYETRIEKDELIVEYGIVDETGAQKMGERKFVKSDVENKASRIQKVECLLPKEEKPKDPYELSESEILSQVETALMKPF